MVDFLEEYSDEAQLYKDNSKDHGMPATTFLDVGTGNGHLLFALRDAGWEGYMLGVDYSAASIRLARQIGQKRLFSTTESKEAVRSDIQTEAVEDEEETSCNLPVQLNNLICSIPRQYRR